MTKEPIIREILEKYYYNDKKPYKKALDLAHQEILKKIPSVDEISDLIIDNLDVRKQKGVMNFISSTDKISRAIHNLLEERMR